MIIPTEPIGSIPRPGYLIEAMTAHGVAKIRARVQGAGLAGGRLG